MCAASQPTGRWGNRVTIWPTPGTLHCGHNSIHMCLITAQWDEVGSPREPEGSSLLPVAAFCLCDSLNPFQTLLPFFFVPTQNRGGTKLWNMYCQRWCKKCYASNHRLHFIWSDSPCFHFVSSTGPFYNMTPEERIDADNRSVYVGNVRMKYLLSPH